MAYITGELIKKLIKENETFKNEYEFQFELAMAIKDENPNLKIKIEQKVYCDDSEQENCRCDIVAKDKKTGEVVLLAELKYVVTLGAQSDKTSMGARISFVSDIKRLYDLDKYPNAEKYCVFISNKTAVYNNNRSGNYYNDNYANEKLWTCATFDKADDTQAVDVRFLIINANEDGAKIPDDYKY